MTGGSRRQQQPAVDPLLTVIHATMLGGLLLTFAAVFFFFGGRETLEPNAVLRWGWLGVAVVAVFVVGIVRGRISSDSTAATVRTAGIMIWATAEGAALVGILTTVLTGNVMSALGGTLIGVSLMVHHRPSRLG